MATKKIKRFQEGGVSDKDRGLEASKGEKVGFFERLRMGNIDDEGSEAYRRFGAGRGKAERTPVEDRVATPTAKRSAPVAPEGVRVTPIPVSPVKAEPKPDQQGSGQTFGQAFDVARKEGLKTFPFKGKSFTTETKEDVAKRKTAAAKKRDDADFAAESARDKTTRSVAGSPNTTQNRVAIQKDADTSATKRSIKDAVNRAPGGDAKRRGADTTSTLARTPARAPGGDAKRRGADTTSTFARTPGGNAKRGGPTSEEEAIQKDADTSATKRSIKDAVNRATQKNEGNNAPRRNPEPLSSVRKPGRDLNAENFDSYDMGMKRGGKVKAYAKGGMTRGDGICVKGKTKGKFV